MKKLNVAAYLYYEHVELKKFNPEKYEKWMKERRRFVNISTFNENIYNNYFSVFEIWQRKRSMPVVK